MPRVLVTGANRGIGLEYTRQYCADGWDVLACARDLSSASELLGLAEDHSNLRLQELDISDTTQIRGLANRLKGEPIDVLINNAGIYGPPGMAFGHLDHDEWLEIFKINTISPIMLSQALLDNLLVGELKKIVLMSSKMGSISDNSSGGSYLYRSSKCALNAAAKSLSIDLRSKGINVITLHPGWVKTDMGGPNALIGVQQSVSGLKAVIAGKGIESSGGFFNYDGAPIAW